MKAEELMKGDWVYVQDCETYEKVESITPTTICTDRSDDWPLDDDIAPVPITPGILERSGFKYPWEVNGRIGWDFGTGWEYAFLFRHPGGGFGIECCNKCEGEYAGVIHNVHELQHALRLCKVEIEIRVLP